MLRITTKSNIQVSPRNFCTGYPRQVLEFNTVSEFVSLQNKAQQKFQITIELYLKINFVNKFDIIKMIPTKKFTTKLIRVTSSDDRFGKREQLVNRMENIGWVYLLLNNGFSSSQTFYKEENLSKRHTLRHYLRQPLRGIPKSRSSKSIGKKYIFQYSLHKLQASVFKINFLFLLKEKIWPYCIS